MTGRRYARDGIVHVQSEERTLIKVGVYSTKVRTVVLDLSPGFVIDSLSCFKI